VRVHADRKSHFAPSRHDLLCLPQLRLIVCREDDERATDSRRLCALDDLVKIRGELRPCDMAMAVDQYGSGLLALDPGLPALGFVQGSTLPHA
jgi:hypothetical protein